MRLVFVDIDGTLVIGSSTERRFYLYLLKTGNQGPRQAMAFLAFLLRWGYRYGRHVLKKNKAYLTGLKTEKIRGLADAWVESVLDRALYAPCLARIRRHQAEGDHVVLLSGSPNFIAEAIGRRLGIETVVGSRCAVNGDRFSWRPPLRHPFADAKVEIAREICREAGSTLAKAFAYADSIHDLPLLEQCGHPVAVRPDQKLATEAAARGWAVVGDRDAGIPGLTA